MFLKDIVFDINGRQQFLWPFTTFQRWQSHKRQMVVLTLYKSSITVVLLRLSYYEGSTQVPLRKYMSMKIQFGM